MNRLKELRKEANATQADMAKILGVTVSAYGNYELGQREPTIEFLCKLADYFNVSVDYLIGHETKKRPDNGKTTIGPCGKFYSKVF